MCARGGQKISQELSTQGRRSNSWLGKRGRRSGKCYSRHNSVGGLVVGRVLAAGLVNVGGLVSAGRLSNNDTLLAGRVAIAAASTFLHRANAIKHILEAAAALFSGAASSTATARAALIARLDGSASRRLSDHSHSAGRARSWRTGVNNGLNGLTAAVRTRVLANTTPLAGAEDILPAATALEGATTALQTAATVTTAAIAGALSLRLARLNARRRGRRSALGGGRRARGRALGWRSTLGCLVAAASSAEAEVVLQVQVVNGGFGNGIGANGNSVLVVADSITPEHLGLTVLGNADSGFVDTVLGQGSIRSQSETVVSSGAGNQRVVGADLETVDKVVLAEASNKELLFTIGGSEPDGSISLSGQSLSFREQFGVEGGKGKERVGNGNGHGSGEEGLGDSERKELHWNG